VPLKSTSNYGFLKELGVGIAVVGILASAAAVLNIILQIVSAPSSTWVNHILSIYRNLFFPMVNNTIGLVVRYFGYYLEPWGKDIIVLYVVVGSANARASYKYQVQVGKSSPFLLVAAVIIWPLLMLFATLHALFGSKEVERIRFRRVVKTILMQICYVLLVVAGALVLHSAEILI